MNAPAPKRSRRKRILLLLLTPLVLVVIALVVGLALVPGGFSHVKFEYRAPARAAAPGPAAPGATIAVPAPAVAAEAKQLYLTYIVPTDLLQREVSALFPITEGVESMLKIHLRNPHFVPDADGSYLRLTIELEVQIVGGKTEERYPGQATVRTQLRYDPAATIVRLARAELAEFIFTGAAASEADVLRPVLQSALASSMDGYEVFKLPRKADYWTRTGASLIRDITVENGQVVVVLGR